MLPRTSIERNFNVATELAEMNSWPGNNMEMKNDVLRTAVELMIIFWK